MTASASLHARPGVRRGGTLGREEKVLVFEEFLIDSSKVLPPQNTFDALYCTIRGRGWSRNPITGVEKIPLGAGVCSQDIR